jgi:transcriptional regulator with XRE-family HTH domain
MAKERERKAMQQTPQKNLPLLTAMATHGMTNRKLARATGLHEITISRLLNSRGYPTPDTQRKIAKALDTVPAQLFEVTP